MTSLSFVQRSILGQTWQWRGGRADAGDPDFTPDDLVAKIKSVLAASGEDTVLTDVFVLNWPKGAAVRVIGNSVTEINVTSPTCFQEIHDQTGFDVPAMFVDALEAALDR